MRRNAFAAPSFDIGNLPACRVVNDNRQMARLRPVSCEQETCLENFLPSPHVRPRALTPQPITASSKITFTYGQPASGQTLGRFIQSDPIGSGGGINTYTYSRSSPVAQTDKNGLQADEDDQPNFPGFDPFRDYEDPLRTFDPLDQRGLPTQFYRPYFDTITGEPRIDLTDEEAQRLIQNMSDYFDQTKDLREEMAAQAAVINEKACPAYPDNRPRPLHYFENRRY